MKTIALIATFDTKGAEADFVRREIEALGCAAFTLDVGVMGDPSFPVQLGSREIAAASGVSLAALAAGGDRGVAVEAMARGAAVVVRRLFDEGRIQGVLSLGGSAGTMIGTSAMRAVPLGVPKVMVSTLASGDTRPYVGTRDICMMYSVLDIAGLNVLSRQVLGNAAAAVCGMVSRPPVRLEQRRLTIAATMFGVTTPCVTRARARLEEAGCEVMVFHATGSGGRAMEELIADGLIDGVLDMTTTELADELVGGVMSAGPDRLTSAGKRGIPQVVCPGAIDMVNFGPLATVPEPFRERQLHVHNATVTLMRTTPAECAVLGQRTAERLNQATGRVTLLLPMRGFSGLDAEGGVFASPPARRAWRDAVRATASSRLDVVEMDAHINDAAFAVAAADILLASCGVISRS